jgi:hypothetical protein
MLLQLYYFESEEDAHNIKRESNEDELEEERRKAERRPLTEEEKQRIEAEKRSRAEVEKRNRLIELKKQLTKRFGNLVRAWKHLDRDGNGKLSFTEFAKVCMDLGPEVMRASCEVTNKMGLRDFEKEQEQERAAARKKN